MYEEEPKYLETIYMSDKEIADRLKKMGGELSDDNINTLAELNGCRLIDMYRKLGLRKPKREKPIPLDTKLILSLYKTRHNDVEISEITGYTITRIRMWRLANDLPTIAKIIESEKIRY